MRLCYLARLMRSSWMLVLAPLALVSFSGCDGEASQRPGEVVLPKASVSSNGSEPRRLLRFEPPFGVNQRANLTTTVSLAMDFDGQHRPGSLLPPMRTTLEAEVNDARDGMYATRFTIKDVQLLDVPGIDEEAARGIRSDLARQSPVGVTGTTARDASGVVRRIDFDPPQGSGAALRQMLSDLRFAVGELPLVLPTEPIGPGAEWAWLHTGPARDMTLTEEAHARLVRFEGDLAVIAVDSELRAQSQAIALPGMPKDARCELLSLSGARKGEVVVDLKLPLPASASIETTMSLDLRVTIKGETKPMTGQVLVKTLWSPQ